MTLAQCCEFLRLPLLKERVRGQPCEFALMSTRAQIWTRSRGSVFNRRYNVLVDTALLGEWSEARDFFKSLDFKLRNKMSAGMHIVAHRSLFREPGDFWQRLSTSYNKRNAIIHRGENANEDEATQAVAVARQMLRIMHEV